MQYFFIFCIKLMIYVDYGDKLWRFMSWYQITVIYEQTGCNYINIQFCGSMKPKIINEMQNFEGDRILRITTVKKKSNWIGAWRSRKVVLFSNRIGFYSDYQMKEQPTIELLLVDIHKITYHQSNSSIIKIQSTQGNYEIEFESPKAKQIWKDQIIQAIRDLKIKKSKMLESSMNNQKKDRRPREVKICGLFNC